MAVLSKNLRHFELVKTLFLAGTRPTDIELALEGKVHRATVYRWIAEIRATVSESHLNEDMSVQYGVPWESLGILTEN